MRVKQTLLNYLVSLIIVGVIFAGGYYFRDLIDPRGADLKIAGQVERLIEEHGYYDLPEGSALEYGAIRGIVDAYGDRFTYFVEPAQTELSSDSLAGSYGGIGATLERTPEGEVVLHPFQDSPALEAGVMDGDVLVKIDDMEVTSEMTIDEVVAAVRGPEGKKVKITIRRPADKSIHEYNIKRADIPLPSVTWNISPLEPRLGVIQINVVAASTKDEILEAVADLQARGANQFAIDLRNNRGGLLDAGVDVASLFLKDGVVLEKQERDQDIQSYDVKKPGALTDLPMVVLVNENTASAAEIIAGAIQAQERAPLIGTPTFGKDSIQLVFELEDHSSLHVTIAKWWVPGLETPIGEGGLQPNIAVAPEEVEEGDIFIETAIQTLFGTE